MVNYLVRTLGLQIGSMNRAKFSYENNSILLILGQTLQISLAYIIILDIVNSININMSSKTRHGK